MFSLASMQANSGHLSKFQHHACASQFKWPHFYCIPVQNVCDGKQNSPHCEEESIALQSPARDFFFFCRHKQICVHYYDIRDECVKCPKCLHDKSLQDVTKYCSCSRYALSCTKEKNVVLWQCPQLQRIISLDNIHINLDDIRFSEGKFIFLMHLKYKCWDKERSTTPNVTFKIHEIT